MHFYCFPYSVPIHSHYATTAHKHIGHQIFTKSKPYDLFLIYADKFRRNRVKQKYRHVTCMAAPWDNKSGRQSYAILQDKDVDKIIEMSIFNT